MRITTPDASDVQALRVIINDHNYWWVNERLRPFIAGAADGDGDDDDADDGDDDADDGDGDGETPKGKFTQEDLNRHATREARKGKRQAIKELMDEFGFGSKAEAEEFIKAARERADADDDGAERRKRELDDRERQLAERDSKAAAKERAADIRLALIDAGAPRDKGKLQKLSRMIDLDDDDADEESIEEAVAELKEEWPSLFESNDDANDDGETRSRDTKTRREGGRRRQPEKADGFARAADRFNQRHPQRSAS